MSEVHGRPGQPADKSIPFGGEVLELLPGGHLLDDEFPNLRPIIRGRFNDRDRLQRRGAYCDREALKEGG